MESDREHVRLNFDAGIWVDVHEFKRSLDACRSHNHRGAETSPACLQPLSEAVTLYDDDFLAGFSLRDSPNFDDWQFFQADSLRRDLSGALEHLVQCYYATGDFASAIAFARRWLMLDRLHEAAHRLLMQLYAWSDQRGAALHQYRECVQVLERELGVAPLEATTKLYQGIKERQEIPLPVPLHALAATHEASVAVEAVPVPTPTFFSDTARHTHALPPYACYPALNRPPHLSTLLQL